MASSNRCNEVTLGDAIGGEHRSFQFTHVATWEAPQAVENALRGTANRPDYRRQPRVTFTDPEVAAVGLTEEAAREEGLDVHVHVKPVRQVGKARAVGDNEGIVKVVLERGSRKLLGATIVASHAGDMLAALTLPLHVEGGSLEALLATTFPPPTLSEAAKVAVRNAVTELG